MLDGRGGADIMTGGQDNDTYYVDDIGDEVSEDLFEGFDLVRSSISYSLGLNVEDLELLEEGGAINGTGSFYDIENKITGQLRPQCARRARRR